MPTTFITEVKTIGGQVFICTSTHVPGDDIYACSVIAFGPTGKLYMCDSGFFTAPDSMSITAAR